MVRTDGLVTIHGDTGKNGCMIGHINDTKHLRKYYTRRKSERPKKQRNAKKIVGKGCGGSLESGTNSRRSVDVQSIHQGSNVRKRIKERELIALAGHCIIIMVQPTRKNDDL